MLINHDMDLMSIMFWCWGDVSPPKKIYVKLGVFVYYDMGLLPILFDSYGFRGGSSWGRPSKVNSVYGRLL